MLPNLHPLFPYRFPMKIWIFGTHLKGLVEPMHSQSLAFVAFDSSDVSLARWKCGFLTTARGAATSSIWITIWFDTWWPSAIGSDHGIGRWSRRTSHRWSGDLQQAVRSLGPCNIMLMHNPFWSPPNETFWRPFSNNKKKKPSSCKHYLLLQQRFLKSQVFALLSKSFKLNTCNVVAIARLHQSDHGGRGLVS